MPDRQIIELRDIEVRLRVGVPEAERAEPQLLRFGVRLELADPPDFAVHDQLDQTVDYAEIIAFLDSGLAAGEPYLLVETAADAVASFALDLSRRCAAVEVCVAKPSVLAGRSGEVSVSIRRTAEGRARAAGYRAPALAAG